MRPERGDDQPRGQGQAQDAGKRARVHLRGGDLQDHRRGHRQQRQPPGARHALPEQRAEHQPGGVVVMHGRVEHQAHRQTDHDDRGPAPPSHEREGEQQTEGDLGGTDPARRRRIGEAERAQRRRRRVGDRERACGGDRAGLVGDEREPGQGDAREHRSDPRGLEPTGRHQGERGEHDRPWLRRGGDRQSRGGQAGTVVGDGRARDGGGRESDRVVEVGRSHRDIRPDDPERELAGDPAPLPDPSRGARPHPAGRDLDAEDRNRAQERAEAEHGIHAER